MANNAYAGTYGDRLNTKDLAVGDKLIRVIRKSNFGSVGTRQEIEYTVEKVLATRLVLRAGERTLRVLVRKSSYNDNGEVQRSIEGQSEWSRESYIFYTPTDPQLIKGREDFALANADQLIKQAATSTLEAFKKSLSIEDAQAAIEKLQAYIASKAE